MITHECIAAAELPDWSEFPNRTTATAAAPCMVDQ